MRRHVQRFSATTGPSRRKESVQSNGTVRRGRVSMDRTAARQMNVDARAGAQHPPSPSWCARDAATATTGGKADRSCGGAAAKARGQTRRCAWSRGERVQHAIWHLTTRQMAGAPETHEGHHLACFERTDSFLPDEVSCGRRAATSAALRGKQRTSLGNRSIGFFVTGRCSGAPATTGASRANSSRLISMRGHRPARCLQH